MAFAASSWVRSARVLATRNRSPRTVASMRSRTAVTVAPRRSAEGLSGLVAHKERFAVPFGGASLNCQDAGRHPLNSYADAQPTLLPRDQPRLPSKRLV